MGVCKSVALSRTLSFDVAVVAASLRPTTVY